MSGTGRQGAILRVDAPRNAADVLRIRSAMAEWPRPSRAAAPRPETYAPGPGPAAVGLRRSRQRRGVDLFNAACEQDLEGIVAKLANGPYEPDATTWVKIKNRAYIQAEGRIASGVSSRVL